MTNVDKLIKMFLVLILKIVDNKCCGWKYIENSRRLTCPTPCEDDPSLDILQNSAELQNCKCYNRGKTYFGNNNINGFIQIH